MSRRLPLPVAFAPVAPTLLAGVLEIARELKLVRLDLETLLLAWLFTTIPLALLVLGLRGLRGEETGDPEGARAAFEAVSRAERAILAAAGSLQTAQDAFVRAADARAGEVRPRSRPPLYAAVAVAFLLTGGGVAYGIAQIEPTPVHIHAGFAIFAHGEQLAFLDPRFDVSERKVVRGHVHVSDVPSGILHLEGVEGDTFPLERALRDALSVNLTDDEMVLDGIAHGNRTLRAEGEDRLHLFVARGAGATWEAVWPIASHKIENRDRILLTFGRPTPEEIERQAAAVPWRLP